MRARFLNVVTRQGKLLNYQRVVTQKECCNLFDCFNIQIGPPTYCTLTPNHHFRAPSLKEQMSNTTSTWLRLKTNDDEFLLHSSTSWDFEMRKFLNFSHRFRAGKSSEKPQLFNFFNGHNLSMKASSLWFTDPFGKYRSFCKLFCPASPAAVCQPAPKTHHGLWKSMQVEMLVEY